MSNLPTIKPQTITALDAAATQGALTATGGHFTRALATAAAVNTLRELLSADVMKSVMPLQNTSLGFMTDRKDAPYSVDTVRDCLIEAVLNGVSPIGNEFNIIAGRCYITKNGMRRKLANIAGLSYTITPSLPKTSANGDGAAVIMTLDWTYNGKTEHKELPLAIRVNRGMGTDAILGKATRKAAAWLYEAVTGTFVNEGDTTDESTTVEAKAVESPIEAETVQTPTTDGELPM